MCGLRPISALDDVTKGTDWQTFRAVQEAMCLKDSQSQRLLQNTGCLNLEGTINIHHELFIFMRYLNFA